MTRGINDGNVVLLGLELPESDVDGDTTFTLSLQFVQHPGILEGALAHLQYKEANVEFFTRTLSKIQITDDDRKSKILNIEGRLFDLVAIMTANTWVIIDNDQSSKDQSDTTFIVEIDRWCPKTVQLVYLAHATIMLP